MIEQLRKDHLQSRKDRNSDKTSLLSTIIGEVTMVAKNDGNRAVSDNDVLTVLKKFLKGCLETIEILEKAGRDTSKAYFEKEILESYLPKQLTEAELTAIVTTIVAELEDKSAKAMGQIMAKLKSGYDGQYDGKMASSMVKKILG